MIAPVDQSYDIGREIIVFNLLGVNIDAHKFLSYSSSHFRSATAATTTLFLSRYS